MWTWYTLHWFLFRPLPTSRNFPVTNHYDRLSFPSHPSVLIPNLVWLLMISFFLRPNLPCIWPGSFRYHRFILPFFPSTIGVSQGMTFSMSQLQTTRHFVNSSLRQLKSAWHSVTIMSESVCSPPFLCPCSLIMSVNSHSLLTVQIRYVTFV